MVWSGLFTTIRGEQGRNSGEREEKRGEAVFPTNSFTTQLFHKQDCCHYGNHGGGMRVISGDMGKIERGNKERSRQGKRQKDG